MSEEFETTKRKSYFRKKEKQVISYFIEMVERRANQKVMHYHKAMKELQEEFGFYVR